MLVLILSVCRLVEVMSNIAELLRPVNESLPNSTVPTFTAADSTASASSYESTQSNVISVSCDHGRSCRSECQGKLNCWGSVSRIPRSMEENENWRSGIVGSERIPCASDEESGLVEARKWSMVISARTQFKRVETKNFARFWSGWYRSSKWKATSWSSVPLSDRRWVSRFWPSTRRAKLCSSHNWISRGKSREKSSKGESNNFGDATKDFISSHINRSAISLHKWQTRLTCTKVQCVGIFDGTRNLKIRSHNSFGIPLYDFWGCDVKRSRRGLEGDAGSELRECCGRRARGMGVSSSWFTVGNDGVEEPAPGSAFGKPSIPRRDLRIRAIRRKFSASWVSSVSYNYSCKTDSLRIQ